MSKNYIVSFQDILHGRNEDFDASNKIQLVRHKDNRKPEDRKIQGEVYKGTLYNLYRTEKEKFLRYQAEQKRKTFNDTEYIVVFIGEDGYESRFIGVYKNCGIIQGEDQNGTCLYDFREIEGFEILKERVVIDWGKSAVSWHQRWDENEKYVVRIDKGFESDTIPYFTRYEDVILSYDQLKNIICTNNLEWKTKLEACNCIYMILDKETGKQYIGSTYNKKGIWGRWADYADTQHGNDKSLIELLQVDENYAQKNFQWTILETLPLNVIADVAIDRESIYKEKFGTRSKKFGYNNN